MSTYFGDMTPDEVLAFMAKADRLLDPIDTPLRDRLTLHPAPGAVESAHEEVQVLRYSTIVLQDGPVGENGENGDQIDEVLAYVVARLREFNQPPHGNRQTSLAITHCEEALHWLADRTAERTARGVEGTSQP